MTAEGKTLKEQYRWEAKSQWKGKALEGDIEVSITLYFGTKRRADLDNFNKLSLDALTGIAYLDDSQIAKLTIERAYDKVRPRIHALIGRLVDLCFGRIHQWALRRNLTWGHVSTRRA
jgi:Holliday junction resolvase RusA-like endonuclease